MNSMIRVGLIGLIMFVAPHSWGQFSVGDDFSTLSGNWFNESTAGGGAFNVSVGGTQVLSYTDGGLTGMASSTGSRDWQSNVGPYAADWQVQVDFTFNLAQVDSQTSSWTLAIGNLADLTDNIQGMFLLFTSAGSPTRIVSGSFKTNGIQALSPYEPHQFSDATNTITFKATYLAATHTLSLYYDADGAGAGRGFDLVNSAPVDAAGLNWGMTSSDAFGFRLAASNSASGATTATLDADKMFADNFSASSTIPEPATYAAWLAGLALLAAAWRRRHRV